jgi:hypothetical protein
LRALAAALLAILLTASCGVSGQRSQADQDRDGKLLAKSIQALSTGGATFTMDEQVTLSGGDVPKGQSAQVHGQATGSLLQGHVQMKYKFVRGGSNNPSFDVVVAEGGFYIRQSGGQQWLVTPEAAATELYPAVRLDLIRESVLLARSIGSGQLTRVGNSFDFAHKYAVTPAPDQLEQLDAMPVQGAAETAFLKSASAEFDIFTSVQGDRLMRVEVHITGTDPSTSTKQKIDCVADFKPAKVKAIETPTGATPVSPNQIFGGG